MIQSSIKLESRSDIVNHPSQKEVDLVVKSRVSQAKARGLPKTISEIWLRLISYQNCYGAYVVSQPWADSGEWFFRFTYGNGIFLFEKKHSLRGVLNIELSWGKAIDENLKCVFRIHTGDTSPFDYEVVGYIPGRWEEDLHYIRDALMDYESRIADFNAKKSYARTERLIEAFGIQSSDFGEISGSGSIAGDKAIDSSDIEYDQFYWIRIVLFLVFISMLCLFSF